MNLTNEWILTLYVAGQSPRSLAAIKNLNHICEKYLPGQYQIEIIDLLERPELAEKYDIIAVPTLIRELPEPVRKIIGDLSDTQKTLVGLQVVHHVPE